jgi:PAS domain S-box-containing protein
MKFETLLLLITTGITLTIALGAFRRQTKPGAFSVLVLSSFLALWSAASLLYQNLPSRSLDNLWAGVILCSAIVAASATFTFCLSYTNRSSWITRTTLVLLGVMPVLTQILFWVKPWHDIFFGGTGGPGSQPVPAGPWTNISAVYIYTLVGVSVLLLLDVFVRKPRPLILRSWPILAGPAVPFMIQMLNIIGLDEFPQFEASLLAFTLTSLGFSYSLFSDRLIEIVPVTREAVVEGMDDGWIVLDMANTIVDINPAAERIIGLSREKVYGQPIATVLSDLTNLGQTLDGNRELEMKRSIKSLEGWRYLNIRISALADRRKGQFGRLIVWRDITDRRLADDARQRARDEMFVLLNAIASAASHAINLDDFLSESIYQIIYPFRSQSVGIFLLDDRGKKDEEPKLFLASHFGLSLEATESMTHMPTTIPLFDWVAQNRQPLLIENVNEDLRIPPAIREADYSCFLTIPLITQAGEESKILGCICLARKEKPVFSQDEVVRLTALSDQIATLIDSDRRRKLAIALSERQRLLRDLHDSVSQKLYGLVTLTEAAQAALDAGSTVNPAQILTRIGENARQAVKEMRLFLFQMQPIDVEKDGLVSALHHRLAAVEGRADIKARLLADDDISISKEKEIALYFIAQEALNNVLRHAHAKAVSVTIKQGRQNVILEVLDDGHGFDPKKVERGGLGLRNMRERTLQVQGKLKISSKPEGGTRIIVSVHKDQHSKAPKKRRQKA